MNPSHGGEITGGSFISFMPDYPQGTRKPLTKRTTGTSSRIIERTDSLRRRTSITRVTPGKPVSSVFAHPENTRPASPSKIVPKIKTAITASRIPTARIQEKPEPNSSSVAIRSGNSDASEKSFITTSAATGKMIGSQPAESSMATAKSKAVYPVTPCRKKPDESTLVTVKKGKAALAITTNEATKSPKVVKEDLMKFPTLRFSPEKPSRLKKLSSGIAGPSSLRKTAIENRATKTAEQKEPKTSRSDIYAWRTSVPRKKVRVISRSKITSYRSMLPVPNPPPSPTKEDEIEEEAEDEVEEGSPHETEERVGDRIGEEAHMGGFHDAVGMPLPDSPATEPNYEFSPQFSGYEGSIGSVEPPSHHVPQNPVKPERGTEAQQKLQETETVSDLRNQFLDALGIEEINLPTLAACLRSINFNTVIKDKLREIKVKEMYQRISIVKLLVLSSRYHGANENELSCVKGWLEDLKEELWMIEREKMLPSKIWFDQLFRWLWHRNEKDESDPSVNPPDDIYVLYNSGPMRVLAAKKEHELFNLRDTGVELLRNGFRNKEKKMLEYWARLRGLNVIPTSCGEDIIGVYMRRFTRWDKIELPETSIQRRRMWYFCIQHYAHWKEAVSFFALSLKMMNLLIVFHDLWGMHVDGMSNQEKKDFAVLHDNLYRFATVFLKPVEEGRDHIWQENECMYCFSNSAADKISHDERGRNIWMWLTQLASIAGYGKYYSAILKTMTDGKEPDYVNQLFETHFWIPRTCSLMTGLKRIKDAMKKHAGPGERMGLGAKKPNVASNPAMNPGLNGFKY